MYVPVSSSTSVSGKAGGVACRLLVAISNHEIINTIQSSSVLGGAGWQVAC